MQQFLAILGSLGFVALGFAMLRYMEAPPVLAWATIAFFGLGAIWMVVRLIYNQVARKAQPGFVDLELPMTEFAQVTDGEHQLTAMVSVGGRLAGFSVRVGAKWHAQPSGGYTLYSGTVALKAIGDASNAFVKFLAECYRMESAPPPMLPEIVVDAVGLDSDPRAIADRPVKMKLFFHPEVEDRYAEVFLNVDLAKRVVQVHEKDIGYRVNVLRALTEALPRSAAASGRRSEG